jgi:toxin ParE1/3/4
MSKKRQRPVKLHFTERALADLVAIETYSVKQHGKRVANRYLSDIEAHLRLIQESPGLLGELEGLPEPLQCYPAGKHVLVFDVEPTSLVLLTVIHGSMDIPNRLAELAPTLATEIELLHKKLRST